MNIFNKGQEVDIITDGQFVCTGIVREASPYDVLLEQAGIPIRLVGKKVEVRDVDTSISGPVFAFGPNCVDRKTDLITVVLVCDKELSKKHLGITPFDEL
jgi:hypothetical protein